MSKKCVFLDRDGILNKDRGYVSNLSKIIWRRNIFKLIEFLKKNKFLICVVTNQSGIARGLFKNSDVIKLHKEMNYIIRKKTSFKIDKFYYCPFYEKGVIKKYRRKSILRKPHPGMVIKYIKKKKLKKKNCIMFGDREIDLICAKNAGIQGYKVKYNMDIFKFVKTKILKNFKFKAY